MYSASAYTPKLGLVIAGGYMDPTGYLPVVVERTFDGHNLEVLTHLPYDLHSHCMVALNDSSIFITGGATFNKTGNMQSVLNKLSFIYNIRSQSWHQVQGLPTPRKGM